MLREINIGGAKRTPGSKYGNQNMDHPNGSTIRG
jgi:hypothetical protein